MICQSLYRFRSLGGLGYPKGKFVDNGQARPPRETVQEGREEECPYKGSLSRQRFGQNRTQMHSPFPANGKAVEETVN